MDLVNFDRRTVDALIECVRTFSKVSVSYFDILKLSRANKERLTDNQEIRHYIAQTNVSQSNGNV